ncbi:hypothetical protein PQR29_06175 [Paraburkholderia strydomiana]|uniref:hypothetical protein n=1 Tax=Paraburkholderia strydomiana TaxID=1245417 RepID=UPI0038B9E524
MPTAVGSGGGLVRSRLCLGLFLYLATLDSTGAWASDIERPAGRPRVQRVIFDHTIVTDEYDDIVARKQVMPSSGKQPSRQLTRFEQFQNACTDARCADRVLSQWATMTHFIEARFTFARTPGKASVLDFAPAGFRSDAGVPRLDANPLSAPVALPTSEASLLRPDSEARAALPQPAASHARPPQVTLSTSRKDEAARAMGPTAGLIALVLVVFSLSVFVIRRNKSLGITTNYRRVRGKKKR